MLHYNVLNRVLNHFALSSLFVNLLLYSTVDFVVRGAVLLEQVWALSPAVVR